ncbi:MAG: putative molybdenum carrier protein [Desulfobacteraceae bacterium]|nr:putative molybdenum carrier protein [Desulfobacteraceae bacterium]MDH3723801.1 putative molybdenum carrier protein [Desulfobacteraceae bacterium]MDH3838045.1 putative molybdenum carrier protein [Desulfobacteraceae bacterium]MDH3875840.1 putative molybdenum carrier protein [Desulfobacteraceae bacterium]
MLKKIISGGQIGADQAALDAAIKDMGVASRLNKIKQV